MRFKSMPSSVDPRSKLVAALAVIAVSMALRQWAPLLIATTVLIGAVFLFHLGRSWFDLLKGLSFALASFFLIAWVAFDWMTGIVAGLRLLALGTIFFLFFQTTSPEALSNALIKMGVPQAFTFVLTASMQFIPVLFRRSASIRDAQRSRGIPLDRRLGAIRHVPALAGPLLIQAFKLADELAEAMEARGFGSPGRRFRQEPRFRWFDWLIVGISIVGVAIFFWVRSRLT